MRNIDITVEYKKGVCQCRSKKCGLVFYKSDIDKKSIYNELLGKNIKYCVCPNCGSTNWGLLIYPVVEFDLLHKNFNGISNKEIKRIKKERNYYDTKGL